MTDYIIGVDAGGTKTCALLADADGGVIGRGFGGPGNVHSVGLASARQAILDAVHAAFDEAKLAPRRVAVLCIGAAGVDRPAEIEVWRAWCEQMQLARRAQIVNDAELVLTAALSGQAGVVTIGGTGSIAFAQNKSGQRVRAGGWGYIIGDKGSAYDITCQALNAVLKEFDGRVAKTALTPAILSVCGCTRPPELVGYVYNSDIDRHKLAQLSIVVDRVAQAGDEVAGGILDRAGDELADLAVAACRSAGLQGPVRCGVAGGVLLRSDRVRGRFVMRMQARGVAPEPIVLVDEPAQGAVLIARAFV